jgi:tRNA dimethylallyltransferase
VPPVPLIAVVGPTASGKSALAQELARRCDGEIINTDSMQVYRHFDIGTAKPPPEARARVPHHLIDVVAPEEGYSAGRYVADALAVLRDLAERGRTPVLCGGTGLYFRALLSGLAPIPPVPGAVQAEVEAELAAGGSAAAHAELARVDPETAAGVHPNDPVRIARALAVYRATGRPISAYRRERPFRLPPARVLSLGLRWEREALYARIDRRVEEMLAQGWIEEVRGILALGYDARVRPMQAIGYREIAAYLRDGGGQEALAQAIATRTRQYAKRQMTWFRKHPDICWAAPREAEIFFERVKKFLLRGRGAR